jgi:phage shock protein PspC (stress-responsive transcriptional regulator)
MSETTHGSAAPLPPPPGAGPGPATGGSDHASATGTGPTAGSGDHASRTGTASGTGTATGPGTASGTGGTAGGGTGAVPGPPRRLVRDPSDQVVAGVCAAFARYTGTDPVLWRVAVAVMALFGGAGVALYLLGWLLVPRAGNTASPVERLLRRPDGSTSTGGVVLLVLLAVVLVGMLDDGSGLLVLAVIGGIAFLVVKERRENGGPPLSGAAGPGPAWSPEPGYAGGPLYGPGQAGHEAQAPPPSGHGASGYGPSGHGASNYGPSGYEAPSYRPPGHASAGGPPGYGPPPPPWYGGLEDEPPAPSRQRSVLGALTVSVAVVVAGLLLALRSAGWDGVTGGRVLAVALLVVGLGLVVGAWAGRARWLLVPGLVLALLLAPVTAIERVGPSGGAGSRVWVPVAGSAAPAYRLGLGEATLDLREHGAGDQGSGDQGAGDQGAGDLGAGDAGRIEARVGIGSLVVLVPADLRVRAVADVGIGDVTVTGPDGAVEERGSRPGPGREVIELGPPGPTDVDLVLRVGFGEVEVRRVEA